MKKYGTALQTFGDLKGWQKLEKGLNEVEALFNDKEFKGSFDMEYFGRHKRSNHNPAEENFCGTAACLAGWLLMSGNMGGDPKEIALWGSWPSQGREDLRLRGGGPFEYLAAEVYDIPSTEAYSLFYTGLDLTGKEGLKLKLEEGRALVRVARLVDELGLTTWWDTPISTVGAAALEEARKALYEARARCRLVSEDEAKEARNLRKEMWNE